MSEKLKKFLQSSQKGRFDDLESIDKIMSRLVNLTSAEIDPMEENSIRQIIEISAFDTEKAVMDTKTITLGEMLGLMHSFSTITSDIYGGVKSVKRCLMNLVYALRLNRGANTTITMFMSVTVKGYFDYLAAIGGLSNKKAGNLFKSFRSQLYGAIGYKFELSEETKISELFGEIVNQLYVFWNIVKPIEEYQNRILGCYDALYTFFIDYFKIGFYSYFDN